MSINNEKYQFSPLNSNVLDATVVTLPITWRLVTTTNIIPTGVDGSVNRVSSAPDGPYGKTVVEGAYGAGGTFTASRKVCYRDNVPGGVSSDHDFFVVPSTVLPGRYLHVRSSHYYEIEDVNAEIDWETTFATLKDTYDPSVYYVAYVTFANSLGDVPNAYHDVVQNGLVKLNLADRYYRDPTDAQNFSKTLFTMETSYTPEERTFPSVAAFTAIAGGDGSPRDVRETFAVQGTVVTPPINTDTEDSANFQNTVNSLEVNTCVTNTYSELDMYLNVYLLPRDVSTDLSDPDTVGQSSSGASLGPSSYTSGSGKTISASNLGSQTQGINRTNNISGNSLISHDSVYLTGSNYTDFFNAEGGIVGESGVFPNGATFYIEKINLDLEGSTMTIREVVDFDTSPSLSYLEKVFGYVLDDNNTSKPMFSGYVVSRKRILNGETEEIIYECRDLTYFLSQFYSPAKYSYTPPEQSTGGIISVNNESNKSVDRVVKEILGYAGLGDSIVELPNDASPPVDWIYEPISNVIEWSTSLMGNYVYFIDRYGRLNIKAKDSGSNVKSYRIPTRGEAVGTHRVLTFNPIEDANRSRSKLVLTGDYELKERKVTIKRAKPEGPLKPSEVKRTGFYWFYSSASIFSVTRQFYFYYETSSPLNESLLSDPSSSVKVDLVYKPKDLSTTVDTLEQRISLPVTQFVSSDNGGHLFAAFDLSMIKNGTVIPEDLLDVYTAVPGEEPTSTDQNDDVDFTFEITLCTRSKGPIEVSLTTGFNGGVEIISRPEFKKYSGGQSSRDDTLLMKDYINKAKEFYKPVVGGELIIDGLDTDITLLDKVSITNTNLDSSETDDLIIHSIEYDIVEKKTKIDLSNKVYDDLPFFNPFRESVMSSRTLVAKTNKNRNRIVYGRAYS